MALHPDLESLVGIPYQGSHGPGKLGQINPWEDGINCQFLLHLALKMLHNAQIPPSFRSKELYEFNSLFTDVVCTDASTVGDAFLFGRVLETDPRHLHVAIRADINSNGEQPLLLHANCVDNRVSIWSLDTFTNHSRYSKLFGMRRLRTTK